MSVSGVSYVQGLDSGEYDFTHVVATVTASGDTVIRTPPAGRRIRLRWIYALNDPGSTASPLINASQAPNFSEEIKEELFTISFALL